MPRVYYTNIRNVILNYSYIFSQSMFFSIYFQINIDTRFFNILQNIYTILIKFSIKLLFFPRTNIN